MTSTVLQRSYNAKNYFNKFPSHPFRVMNFDLLTTQRTSFSERDRDKQSGIARSGYHLHSRPSTLCADKIDFNVTKLRYVQKSWEPGSCGLPQKRRSTLSSLLPASRYLTRYLQSITLTPTTWNKIARIKHDLLVSISISNCQPQSKLTIAGPPRTTMWHSKDSVFHVLPF